MAFGGGIGGTGGGAITILAGLTVDAVALTINKSSVGSSVKMFQTWQDDVPDQDIPLNNICLV